jgi:hypothetical protein
MSRNFNTNNALKEVVDIYTKLQSGKYDMEDVLKLEVSTVSDPEHACYRTELVQVKSCGTQNTQCEEKDSYICRQPPMRGNCGQPPEMRFYYSLKEKRCGMFMYTGCEGSSNVFEEYEYCQAACESELLCCFHHLA